MRSAGKPATSTPMPYRFSFKKYLLPLRIPLRTAHGWWAEREGLIVRLENETGITGFGEIAPIPWFGTETMVEAEEVLHQFGNMVPEELLDKIPARFGCVRFAIAQARSVSSPVTSKNRLPVAALLPAGRDGLRVLVEKLEAGFLTFKWKVGVGDREDELGILDDLLAQIPTHTKLRLDANGAWDRRTAARWLTRCADRPIEFVEQPVSPAEEDTLLGLANDYPVKLALDESVVHLSDARRWQGLGWPGVFVIKPALAGPLNEVIDWILKTKADVVFSSAIESSLARSAILSAVLEQPLSRRALGFGVGEIFGDRRWDGPFIGPLIDAGSVAQNAGEELWNALN